MDEQAKNEDIPAVALMQTDDGRTRGEMLGVSRILGQSVLKQPYHDNAVTKWCHSRIK